MGPKLKGSVNTWAVCLNLAVITPSTAASILAELNTINGAFPPSSRETLLIGPTHFARRSWRGTKNSMESRLASKQHKTTQQTNTKQVISGTFYVHPWIKFTQYQGFFRVRPSCTKGSLAKLLNTRYLWGLKVMIFVSLNFRSYTSQCNAVALNKMLFNKYILWGKLLIKHFKNSTLCYNFLLSFVVIIFACDLRFHPCTCMLANIIRQVI